MAPDLIQIFTEFLTEEEVSKNLFLFSDIFLLKLFREICNLR